MAVNGVRSLRFTQMLILELLHDFRSAGGERFHMRRGDELPVTGDQSELMGAGGGGDDAIRGIAVEIRNAVGVAGDFRGEGEEFQAVEECLGDPFFEGSAEGESAVGLFLGDLDEADGREGDGILCQEDFTDPKRDLGGGLTKLEPGVGIEQVIHGSVRLAG